MRLENLQEATKINNQNNYLKNILDKIKDNNCHSSFQVIIKDRQRALETIEVPIPEDELIELIKSKITQNEHKLVNLGIELPPRFGL